MKQLLLFFLVFLCSYLAGQNSAAKYGFYVSGDVQLLGIQPVDSGDPNGPAIETGQQAPGASIGGLVRLPLWRSLYFQPELGLSWMQNKVNFVPNGAEKYRFTDLEIPVHIVFMPEGKGFPIKSTAIFGGRFSWNMANQNYQNLQLLRERFAIDAGLGLSFKILENWRMQTEILYSHCLNNLHDYQNLPFDEVSGRIVRDRLSLRLLFVMD